MHARPAITQWAVSDHRREGRTESVQSERQRRTESSGRGDLRGRVSDLGFSHLESEEDEVGFVGETREGTAPW